MAKNLAGLAALGALGLLMSRKQGGSGDNAPMGVADDVPPRPTFGENPNYAPAQGPDTTGAEFEMPNNVSYSNEKTINSSSNRTPARTNRPSNASQGLDANGKPLPLRDIPQLPEQMNYGRGRATQGPVKITQGARPYDPTQGTAPREEPLQGVHPETALLPGAGLKSVASLAKMFANKDKGPYFNQQALANNPTRQLSGPSKAELMARDRAARAEAKREEMLKENAANYGLNPNAPGYSAAAQSLRENIGGKDFTVKKKGGSIKAKSKPMKLASGGSARSSASKRGDGIASKGRTRGKMY
jgi:hypothetical protein